VNFLDRDCSTSNRSKFVNHSCLAAFSASSDNNPVLPHFPILFRCLSAESSLHNTSALQDCLLQFLATTTYRHSQNPTVDIVFVQFDYLHLVYNGERPPTRVSCNIDATL